MMKNCIEIKQKLLMQKKYYYFMLQLCFFIVLMSLDLTLVKAKTAYPVQQGAASSHSMKQHNSHIIKNSNKIHTKQHMQRYRFKQKGFYGVASVNYEYNLAKGDTSDIQLTAISQTLRHVNDNAATGPGVTIEFGYQWPIASRWSWSLGGQFSYYDFTQKGNAQLMNFGLGSYPYQYHVTAMVGSAVGRLIYTRCAKESV